MFCKKVYIQLRDECRIQCWVTKTVCLVVNSRSTGPQQQKLTTVQSIQSITWNDQLPLTGRPQMLITSDVSCFCATVHQLQHSCSTLFFGDRIFTAITKPRYFLSQCTTIGKTHSTFFSKYDLTPAKFTNRYYHGMAVIQTRDKNQQTKKYQCLMTAGNSTVQFSLWLHVNTSSESDSV